MENTALNMSRYVLVHPPAIQSISDLIDSLHSLDGGDDATFASWQTITLPLDHYSAVTKWIREHPPPPGSLRKKLLVDYPKPLTLILRYPPPLHRAFLARVQHLIATQLQALRDKDTAHRTVVSQLLVSPNFPLGLGAGSVQHLDLCMRLCSQRDIGVAFAVVSGAQREDRAELVERVLCAGDRGVARLVLFDLGPFGDGSRKTATVSKWGVRMRDTTLDGRTVVEVREVERLGSEVVFRDGDGAPAPNTRELVLPMRVFYGKVWGVDVAMGPRVEQFWAENIAVPMAGLCQALTQEEMREDEKAGWDLLADA